MFNKAIGTAVVLLLLTGCSSSAARERELEKEMSVLNEKLSKLEQNNSTDTNQNSKPNESATTNNQTPDLATIQSIIDTFRVSTEALTKTMDETTSSNNRNENINVYMEIKAKMDSLEREIDLYDDTLESYYRATTLSYSDYQAFENQLDALDDNLDKADDNLEIRLQLDD